MSWTDERVELLKKLWADGLSASQIAGELGGITRNAVIGKVHRLGLSGRAKSPSSTAPRQRKPRSPSMMRISRPSVRGNTALAYDYDLEPEPEVQVLGRVVFRPVSSDSARHLGAGHHRGVADGHDTVEVGPVDLLVSLHVAHLPERGPLWVDEEDPGARRQHVGMGPEVGHLPLEPLGQGSYEDAEVALVGQVFRVESDGPFRFADGEVVEARFVTRDELAELRATVPFCPDGLAIVLPLIGW